MGSFIKNKFLSICLIFFVVGYFPLYGQAGKVDSLRTELKKPVSDTIRVHLLLELGREYVKMRDDSAALQCLEDAVKTWEKAGNTKGVADLHAYIGSSYYASRNYYKKSLEHHKISLNIYEELVDILGIARACHNIGLALNRLGNTDEGLPYLHRALKLAEELDDKKAIGLCLSTIGNTYADKGDYTSALSYLEKSLKIMKEIDDKSGIARLYVNIASIYGDLGNPKEGLSLSAKALLVYEELGNKQVMALIYSNMAKGHNALGNNEEALQNLKRSVELREELGDRYGMAFSLNEIAWVNTVSGKYDEALENSRKAMTICEEFGDKYCVAETYRMMGYVYTAQGKIRESMQSYTRALQICEETGKRDELAAVLNEIGTLNQNYLGNYPKAMENFLEALRINDEIGNKRGVAQANLNIGSLLNSMGRLDEASSRYKMALELYTESGLKGDAAFAYHRIGENSRAQGSLDEALTNMEAALSIYEELGYKAKIAHAHGTIGFVYYEQRKYEEALRRLRLSLNISEEIDYKEGETRACLGIGETLIKLAGYQTGENASIKLNEALQYLTRGKALADETGDTDSFTAAYEGFINLYTALKDYRKALEYQTLSIALKDSLLNNETTRQLEQLRTQYEVEKAVAVEKAEQDSLLSAQRFQSEKELAERNAQHQLEIAEAKAQEERAVEAAKYRYLLQLAAAKSEQEKQLAEQQYQNDLRIAEENARHRIALADEKAKQEEKEAEEAERRKRERAERERRAEMALSGGGLAVLLTIFFLMYQRQRNLKQKAIERADTIHKMTELELQSLRAQLNPHFMFNSLNAIQELILLEENDKSHTYLARFAKLLRMLLENANNPFIPLARELEFLQLYLSLEKLRIPDLQYAIQVAPDIQTEQTKIPNMILQPYIENAIWHGLSPKKGSKKLDIRVEKQNGYVIYEIEDNGIGRQKAAELKSLYRKEHKSRGMELLTKRFKLLSQEYGSEIKTTIEDIHINQNISGTKVCILVPEALEAHPELA